MTLAQAGRASVPSFILSAQSATASLPFVTTFFLSLSLLACFSPLPSDQDFFFVGTFDMDALSEPSFSKQPFSFSLADPQSVVETVTGYLSVFVPISVLSVLVSFISGA